MIFDKAVADWAISKLTINPGDVRSVYVVDAKSLPHIMIG